MADQAEGEPEVKMIDWYIFEGSYDEDKDGWHEMNPEETVEYYERITKSDGFDAPYFPKVMVFGNIEPLNLLSYSGFKAHKCAKFALEEHNKAEEKNYLFHDVLKANHAAAAGTSYYITFEAEDPDMVSTKDGDAEAENIGVSDTVRIGPSGFPLVIFEAEVFLHLPDKNREEKMVVHNFRKKRSQIP